MSSDIIFEPLRWPKLSVKNRVFRSNISGRFDNEDGSGTQTRINWECKFARGGVGAIISSFVPVAMEGRIMAGYATIHRDEHIAFWRALVKAVHAYDCNYLMQLSHSGRQMDYPGVHNQNRLSLSSTSSPEALHGFLCRAMTQKEIDGVVNAFADAAWRAREAGCDGVELHGANGYLITQFLSSGINDRTDQYGGSLQNRARFLLEIIEAIRAKVGAGFHLQVKISAVDHHNLLPWEGKGNTLTETVQICQWLERAGVDALHISIGSMFPHPLNPIGDFDFETIATTYDTMLSAGIHTLRNYALFRYRSLRPIYRWLWFRMSKGKAIEGVSLEEARTIKAAVSIPVISTGGYQTASAIRNAITSEGCDAVSIARALVANNALVESFRREEVTERPCTYCNKCLLNAPKNPLGCYELSRFDDDYQTMIDEIMSVYHPGPELKNPSEVSR